MKLLILTMLIILASISNINADINTGLVAHYEFEDNLNDTTDNHFNGVADGSLTYGKGVINQGLVFSSYPNLVKIENSSLLKEQTETTVSMWLKPQYTNRDAGVISAGGGNEYLIFVYANGTFDVTIGNNSYVSDMKINDGFFHFISVVTTSSAVSIYVDGKLDKQFDVNLNAFTFDTYVWLGNDQDSQNGGWSTSQQYYGVMDDLRFHHRALSANDIDELYKLGSINLIEPRLQYADLILDSYYSNANNNFSTFYGGIGNDGPKIVPVAYAADGDETTTVSLPTGSYITVGFSKVSIIDAPDQDDLFIVEGGPGGEDAKVYVSSDFKNFVYLGLAQDDVTTSFDLADIGFDKPVVAVKVVGQDNGGSWPGFDLFEVKGLSGSLIENTDQCKDVIKVYGKSPNTDKWILFSNPCDLPEGWETSLKKPNDVLCNNVIVITL